MARNIKQLGIPEDLQDKISETINAYAVEKGDVDGNALNERIRSQMNSSDPAVRAAGENAAVDTINTLAPKVFLQFVDNFGTVDALESQMMEDYWGVYDEGNGFERYVLLTEAPEFTNLLTGEQPFLPRAITPGMSQNWVLNYVTQDRLHLTDEAYAFKQNLVYQQTSLLTQFRTGAGMEYLITMVKKLYDSLKYIQYHKWASTKFKVPSAAIGGRNLVHQDNTSRNAFECWVEIFTMINKMCMNNSNYNYNGTFENLSTLNYSDITLYMSNKTYITLKQNLMSQLYNNANFAEILKKVKIVVPSYKLKWKNKSGQQVQVGSVQVANNTLTDPQFKLNTIPSGLIWATDGTEYIPDDKVFISTKYSFMWVKQSHMNAKQFFANNFTDLTTVYEMGAMTFNPSAKFAIYSSNNLNTNPATIQSAAAYNLEPTE